MNAGHVLSVHGKPSPDGLGGPDYRSSLNLNTKVLKLLSLLKFVRTRNLP